MGEPTTGVNKLANTILYLLEHCGSAPPGKQALLKMLWYADYWHYREHLRVITGAEYVAMTNGPVLENYRSVLAQFVDDGILGYERVPIYGKDHPKEEYSPLLEADTDQFSEIELRTLKQVVARCAGKSGSELSESTHREGPWPLAWDAQRPNQPMHRMLFRWLDNLPDETDCERALQSLEKPSVQRELAALRAA